MVPSSLITEQPHVLLQPGLPASPLRRAGARSPPCRLPFRLRPRGMSIFPGAATRGMERSPENRPAGRLLTGEFVQFVKLTRLCRGPAAPSGPCAAPGRAREPRAATGLAPPGGAGAAREAGALPRGGVCEGSPAPAAPGERRGRAAAARRPLGSGALTAALSGTGAALSSRARPAVAAAPPPMGRRRRGAGGSVRPH